MTEDSDAFVLVTAAAERLLNDETTRHLLLSAGISGDLVEDEIALVQKVAGFPAEVSENLFHHLDFVGVAQALVRRVLVGDLEGFDNPVVREFVRRAYDPSREKRGAAFGRITRDLTPQEVIRCLPEFLASDEYKQTRKALSEFEYDEAREESEFDQRYEIMSAAHQKSAEVLRKYGIPAGFTFFGLSYDFPRPEDVPDNPRELLEKMRREPPSLVQRPPEDRTIAIVDFNNVR